MKNEAQISDELLINYLLGEASDEQKDAVACWIDASAANMEAFEQYKLIWEQSKSLASESAVDENAAWQRFAARTKECAMLR